MIMRKSK
jgi:hypothetical protein